MRLEGGAKGPRQIEIGQAQTTIDKMAARIVGREGK